MDIPQTYRGRRLRWSWDYRDESGKPIGLKAVRYDDGTDKVVIPYRLNGSGHWKAGAAPEPRPLFGLPTLAAARERGGSLVIVEGEKCAAALHSLGFAAVTSQGGAGAAGKADWTPCSGFARCYVLPDANEAGRRYARDVCAALGVLPEPPEELLIVDLPGLPEGGDVVDWLRTRLPDWDGFGPVPPELVDEIADELKQAIRRHATAPPDEWTGGEPWPDPEPLPEAGDTPAGEFPIEALPPVLLEAAREIARFCKVPLASPAVVGLSLAAVAIGKQACISERRGLSHWAALFVALVTGSGERKTPVFKLLQRALLEWIELRLPEWEAAKRQAEALNATIDAQVQALKAAAKKPGADVETTAAEIAALQARRKPVPPHPRMFTSNTTPEMLFRLLDAHGGAYAVLSGEGRDVFDNIMGRYAGDNRTGDSIYLAGISGDAITRDRIGNADTGPEERFIPSPCLNVCVMVQPDKYREAATHPALRGSGALARIWPVVLPELAGTRFEEADEPDLDEQALSGFANAIKRLLGTEAETPHHVTLSPEAKEGRRLLHNRIEGLQREELTDVRDIASKATSQTVKLSLVLHLLEHPEALAEPHSEVSGATWARAQALGLFFLQEAVRTMREALEDDALEPARKVLGWIHRQRLAEVTSTDLMQKSPRPRPTAEEAAVILDLLVDYGWLKPCRDPGKRKPVYRVHPALFSQISQISRGEGEK